MQMHTWITSIRQNAVHGGHDGVGDVVVTPYGKVISVKFQLLGDIVNQLEFGQGVIAVDIVRYCQYGKNGCGV